jgi:hypothetical protein
MQSNIRAHEKIASSLKENSQIRKSNLLQIRSALEATDSDAIRFGHTIPSGTSGANNISKSNVIQQHSDVGSRIRATKRRTFLESAHNSLARHDISASRKDTQQRLFKDQLRLNHLSGKYEEVNFADPKIPIAGVGISIERVSIPSLLIPSSILYELRVSHVDPDSAAGLSRRINVGDVLMKASRT